MTGRDEGCERRAAPRAEALLSAPPTKAHQSETCGSKRRPISVPSRRRDAIRCNFDESRCNPTATRLQLPARNCTRLHQIAPNCTKLRSLRQKIKKEKNRPDEKYPSPIFLLPSYCLQSGRGVLPPGLESTAAGRRRHPSRLVCTSPSQAVRDIESGWIQPAPIQVNPG